ncbi:MAG TPA: hypothetical protein PLV45_12645 [bacterium]|nr:hypothetical protein [bacterium]
MEEKNYIALRRKLEFILNKWIQGTFNELNVMREAENLIEEYIGNNDWPEFSEDDPRSIAEEAMSMLESLDSNRIIRADIPCFKEFLNTPRGKEKEAWRKWQEYWDTADYSMRGKVWDQRVKEINKELESEK